MRKLGITIGVIVAGITLLIATYELGYTYRYRYRLAIEVDVDGQVKSGSSVIQVTRRLDPVPGRPWGHYSTAAIGEAVFVDLGPRGNLFVLLTNEGSKSPELLGARTFHFDPTDTTDTAEQQRRAKVLTAERAQAELRPDQLPLLVTFANLDDPATARVVQPDEFAQVFGAGVRLRRAWVEMTSDPVTRGIEKALPWWNKPLPWLKPLEGGVYVDTRSDPFRINKEQFKKGS
jgi:hypothetical protein